MGFNNTQVVNFDALRSVAHGSVTSSYVALGTPFTHFVRLMKLVNNTDGDMLFSFDGVNDQIIVPAGSATIYDFNTNRILHDQLFVLQSNSQIYVKYSSAPTTGTVYAECVWGE